MTADIAGDDFDRTDQRSETDAGRLDDPTVPETLRFDDRLLAEAVRQHEADGHEPIHDDQAERLARRAGGDLERRIVCRAWLLDVSSALVQALRRTSHAAATVVLIGILLALLGGAGAARAALGTSGTAAVNIVLVLIALLGVQTLLLLAWIAVVVVRPSVLAGGSLGGIALALGQRLAGRMHQEAPQLAAIRAIGSVFAHSAVGKWNLSAISHGTWLSFNVGAIVVVVMLLGARDYTFVWETTILSERSYVASTRVVGAGPARLGFLVPSDTQVRASRLGGQDAGSLEQARSASQAWAGLLVGSIMLYGLVPRTAALVVALFLARRATRGFRLDLTHPGYRRLHGRLMPPAEGIGVVEADRGAAVGTRRLSTVTTPAERPIGPPAVVGYEITPPRPWPPPLHGMRWVDLGFVDDRQAATRVLEELRTLEREPSTVLVVCELTTTPDRGVQRFLEEIAASGREAASLLLTAGDRLRQRMAADHVATRAEDWRLLAGAAGIAPARVLELDLDHATTASLEGLERLLQDGEATPATPLATPRHVEEAFELVATHAAGWSGSPDRNDQIKLQVAIARLYRDGEGRWQQLLRLPDDLQVRDVAAMTGQIRRSAERMVELLPGRLRSSPRWLAAGAVTGALGCVTAAMLLSPVAISALPIWSGLGAGVAAAIRLGAGMQGEPEPSEPPRTEADLDAAVRSAALFAVLLELQGADEARISRVLEATFSPESDTPLRTPADARSWLDESRHRLDLALTREAGP